MSGVDEDAVTATTPADLALRLAERKAAAVAQRLGTEAALVLGCDSLLELDGRALGKPGTVEAATARWRELRGRTGTLHTGHCLIDTAAGKQVSRAVGTEVRFADIDDHEIEAYCGTGEPNAVAGAFTLDGFGGWFIEGVDGDHHNVVGVSLPVLRSMLRDLGHRLGDIGYPAR